MEMYRLVLACVFIKIQIEKRKDKTNLLKSINFNKVLWNHRPFTPLRIIQNTSPELKYSVCLNRLSKVITLIVL
jgi:hypothetical protein